MMMTTTTVVVVMMMMKMEDEGEKKAINQRNKTLNNDTLTYFGHVYKKGIT
jgi:hypothetical protein